MSEPYDSTADTREHIAKVAGYLSLCADLLRIRAATHDASKLEEPEKSTFDRVTPLLRNVTYGSDEYKTLLAEMGAALQHHYAHNSHHPQFFGNGIDGMTLLDIIEMLADWRAAAQRHADGDFGKSLEINRVRFGISDQLAQILENTRRELGW